MLKSIYYSDDNFDSFITPGADFFLVKNKDARAIGISESFSRSFGYQNPINYLGLSDYDLKCPAAELADCFITQDNRLRRTGNLERYLTLTSFYKEKVSCLLSTKQAHDGNIICNGWQLKGTKISQLLLTDIEYLYTTYGHQINKSYRLVNNYGPFSIRESEVIYLLMRRKSSTQIASLLNLSKRTIEHYISNMKNKLYCDHLSQIIDFSIYSSYVDLIPISLIKLPAALN